MNDSLTAGQIIDATVMRLEHYGALIDYEGRTGLITLPEISWSRIRHPGERLAVGDRIPVKVLVVAPGREFSASIRQLNPELDPWIDPARFRVGSEHEGKVVVLLNYGCFVEIRPDVWGLLRKEHWPHPMQIGDLAKVRVTSVDARLRKIEVEML